MRVVKLEDVKNPVHGEFGEEIYELIGRPSDLGGTSKHSVAYVVIPPGKSSPAHIHNLAEETYYVISGRGTMQVNSERFPVQAGLAVMIAPSEIHQIWNEEGQATLEFLAISGPPWTSTDQHRAELPDPGDQG